MLLNGISKIKKKIHYKKIKQENDEMLESIQKAQKEWMDKENYFEYATDPDLVDFAIYEVEASKRKYAYLLKLAKEQNKL
jgi:hypothetical protein